MRRARSIILDYCQPPSEVLKHPPSCKSHTQPLHMDVPFHHPKVILETSQASVTPLSPNDARNSLFQGLNGPNHNFPPYSWNVHSHLLHHLDLPNNPNVRHCASSRSELSTTRHLETDLRVFPPGVGPGTGSKDSKLTGCK